jgi:stage II sporulation protein D
MKKPERLIALFLVLFALVATSGIAPFAGKGKGEPVKKARTANPKTPDYNKFTAAEILLVKILSLTKAKEVVFAPETGVYQVVADGKTLLSLDVQNALKIAVINDSLEVKSFERNWGRFLSVKLVSQDVERSFKLKSLNPERKPRFFDDNLMITPEAGLLRMVNETVLDNYIAGVSESESGLYSPIEYYKVQAILARTYALTHIAKHGAEGFNLCDQVHCQAFYGKSHEAKIIQAVNATRGKVVVDDDMNLIVAAFHSNSGGQTANSEDVWGTSTSYLRSVPDTFSYKMPNARWTRKMPVADWLDYLKLKHNFPVEDSLARAAVLNFKQESRKVYLEYGHLRIPLKNIRADFQLKSTFFSLEPQGDTLVFYGRGFGHGIGMCQEGAMRMTKNGYNYRDVLNFYYRNVHLIDLKDLNFFRE